MKDSRDITKIIKAADYRTEGQNAIQKAVEICTAQGGGTVLIEAGEWTSGSIHLTSHIHFSLKKEQRLLSVIARRIIFRWYSPVGKARSAIIILP